MKQMSPTRKRYDQTFKDEAVRLLIESGKAAAQVVGELGVSTQTLANWKKAALEKSGPVQADGRELTSKEMFEEIRRLQKEVDYLKRQREILKKAMSILSEGPTSAML